MQIAEPFSTPVPTLTDHRTRASAEDVAARFHAIRTRTTWITDRLAAEDQVIQSMEDTSPTKWHLAHTTWFFETFVLNGFVDGYQPFNEDYPYLFNSYYVQAGERFSRPRRGILSRPTVAEIRAYRDEVDRRVVELLGRLEGAELERVATTIELGLHHEMQHQELVLTDIKHVLWQNPLNPVFANRDGQSSDSRPMGWLDIDEGIYEIGTDEMDFAFDNEGPRHRVFIEPVRIADRLVTNSEYLEFIRDGGYRRSELWLSEGWAIVEADKWDSPIYWERSDAGWSQFTLFGLEPVRGEEPVCHVSYFEADAFARWAGMRLPTEHEWEVAAGELDRAGNYIESGALHPRASGDSRQFYGDVWEWTQSAYAPYPGYRAAAGALGEYNGKFMCNQYVLRGGSCATSLSQMRRTYRNFFHTAARWQFNGIRLADDGSGRGREARG